MADFENTVNGIVVDGTNENDSIVNGVYHGESSIGSYATIQGYDGNDTIRNYAYNVTIYGGEGENRIENRGQYVLITTGAGNDSVYTDIIGYEENYRNVTVYAGAGNDTLSVLDHETYLNGEAGNDIVSVIGGRGRWSTNTLEGGQGNDTMYGGNKNVFPYVEGDGDDIIYNFADGDTLKIEPNEYTTLKSGDDVIINTAGNGHITLVGAADKNIYVNDDNINPSYDSTRMQLSRWSYEFSFDNAESDSYDVNSSSLISANEFTYYYGSGNQIMENVSGGATINLSGVTMEQIMATDISTDAVSINFADGSNLIVTDYNNANYVVDGTTWTVNQDSQTWIKQE